jgi:hypothetical protein
MKKSNLISLLVLPVIVSSCIEDKQASGKNQDNLHIRTDTVSTYSTISHYHGGFVHFIPYGIYSGNGAYHRTGYLSESHPRATSRGAVARSFTAPVSRGGFGGSARMSVSS